ncbi:MAG: hypothetical protein EPO21_24350 [Chloroflexota bacterium]|nr:MAG: hypothetical protein EPO21_24350 [Chloroflexota bacterium]
MAGETLWTKDHQIIRRWAEERAALPAFVPGTEQEGGLGVLRFDFPAVGGQNLRHITWEQFFKAFDERDLTFVYQETQKSGQKSFFFRFDNAHRNKQ